jgi:hypothetical protein
MADAGLAEVGTSNVIDDRAPLPSIQGYELSHEVVAGRKGATEFLDVLRMGPLFILAIGAVRQKNEDPKKVVGLTRNLVRIHIKDTTDPGELLKLINADIFPQLEPKTFVSLLIAVLDPMPGRLSFSRAGLTAPVLVRPARRQHVRLQDFEGMPLGADPGPMFNPTVSSSRLQLEQNDLFVLHSEGIFNVRNRLREPYGEGRFSQVLDRCGLHEAEYFRDKLREKIDLFARAEGALSNGYAVLALKRSTPVSTQLTWSA